MLFAKYVLRISFCLEFLYDSANLNGQEFVHDLAILLRYYNDSFGIFLNKCVLDSLNLSVAPSNGSMMRILVTCLSGVSQREKDT